MCKHQKFIVVHLLHLSSDPSSFSSQTWSVLSRHLANTFSPASVIGISATQLLTQVTVQHTFHLSAAFFNRFHFFRSTFPNLPFLQGFLSRADGSSPNRILFFALKCENSNQYKAGELWRGRMECRENCFQLKQEYVEMYFG